MHLCKAPRPFSLAEYVLIDSQLPNRTPHNDTHGVSRDDLCNCAGFDICRTQQTCRAIQAGAKGREVIIGLHALMKRKVANELLDIAQSTSCKPCIPFISTFESP